MEGAVDLANFGFGAVLIGAFFIPMLFRKDTEIARLNTIIQGLQEQRLTDMKEVVKATVEPITEFNGTAKAFLQIAGRHHEKE